ncbi:MAG: glycosyltransferase family 2 protein [Pseudomonadota bacterium]
MRKTARIVCIIPALNEADAISRVISEVPDWVDRVIVADNGSTDATADVAGSAGALVVSEPQRGYGAACLAGIAAADDADVIVFLDGDYSDRPGEMVRLVAPILEDRADMVIGSRVLGTREHGALTPQQVFGNWLATRLIRSFWGVHYTDLGPFRAIRKSSLDALGMADRNFGWTVEMQIKAARKNLRTREVPVSYRRRIGVSKISGTIVGSVKAGTIILQTIAASALADARARRSRRAGTVVSA